jgi:response regulator of citrate/malate metabolism
MFANEDCLEPKILDYFRLVKSSEESISAKFPETWRHTSIFDILTIIALANGYSYACDFQLIRKNLAISETTLDRYLCYLKKSQQIFFDLDTTTERPTNLRLAPPAIEAFQSALAIFSEAEPA